MQYNLVLTKEGSIHLRERHLTRRQVEVVESLLNSSDRSEISAYLAMGLSGFKAHLTSIYKKLDVKCLHELLLYLFPYVTTYRNDIIPMPEPVRTDVIDLPVGIGRLDESISGSSNQ